MGNWATRRFLALFWCKSALFWCNGICTTGIVAKRKLGIYKDDGATEFMRRRGS